MGTLPVKRAVDRELYHDTGLGAGKWRIKNRTGTPSAVRPRSVKTRSGKPAPQTTIGDPVIPATTQPTIPSVHSYTVLCPTAPLTGALPCNGIAISSHAGCQQRPASGRSAITPER